jgi:hypothetical protein
MHVLIALLSRLPFMNEPPCCSYWYRPCTTAASTAAPAAHTTTNTLEYLTVYCRTSAAAIHGQALDAEPSSLDAPAEASGGSSPDSVTLGRLVAGVEWRRPLAANWSGTAGQEFGQPIVPSVSVAGSR